MIKEYRIQNKCWLYIGMSKGFGLGFRIDRYHINIDFLWFWVGFEF